MRAMGRTPLPRQPWADERSIALVGRILGGHGDAVRTSLAAKPSDYDVPLIAMWGFYRAKSAGSDRAMLEKAVEVMEIAQPYFAEPQLVAAITEHRSRLAVMR